MGRFIDLKGERFGRLTVLSRAENRNSTVRWFCICDCGNYKTIDSRNLRESKTRSCGCLQVENGKHIMSIVNNNIHGYAGTPTYESWRSMKRRVVSNSPKCKKWYKDKGIIVCDRWQESFLLFLEDMGERPSGHTLDRIDSNGNYEPSNCRWATYHQQRVNQNR